MLILMNLNDFNRKSWFNNKILFNYNSFLYLQHYSQRAFCIWKRADEGTISEKYCLALIG